MTTLTFTPVQIIISIDYREAKLIPLVQSMLASEFMTNLLQPLSKYVSIQTTTDNLPLGDIVFRQCVKECIKECTVEDFIIVERKSLPDLLSSIKDKRYAEQSFRLQGCPIPNHNIVYLIEDVSHQPTFFNKKFEITEKQRWTSYSAMFSLQFTKGFSVWRSNSLEETAKLICNIAYKMAFLAFSKKTIRNEKNEKTIEESIEKSGETIKNSGETMEEKGEEKEEEKKVLDVTPLIQKNKKDNITVDNIQILMLCQIPYVTVITATAILSHFQNITNLSKALKEDEQGLCLQTITFKNEKQQTKKLNKTVIQYICTFCKHL